MQVPRRAPDKSPAKHAQSYILTEHLQRYTCIWPLVVENMLEQWDETEGRAVPLTDEPIIAT